MSNQRVVVLTERLLEKLNAVLEHPGGITDDMVERGKHAFARETLRTHASMSQLDAENDLVVRSVLEAALIPESSRTVGGETRG